MSRKIILLYWDLETGLLAIGEHPAARWCYSCEKHL